VVALGLAPSLASAQAISDEAKQHFRAGVAFLEDPDGAKIEEAYREFRRAYEISKSPKVLGNLGICAMKLERDGEAIEALGSYLRNVDDISEAERNQVTRDLQTLRTSAVRLALSFAGAPNGAEISIVDVRVAIRGEKVTNTYKASADVTEISVRPGHHIVTARVAGLPEEHWEIDAAGGAKEAHAFQFRVPPVNKVDGQVVASPLLVKPLAQTTKPSIAPWIVVGAGGALAAAGTVTGIVALAKTSAIARECPDNVCPAGFELNAARSGARRFVTATDVLLISGSAVAAGGFVWWLLSRNRAEQSAPPPAMVGCGPQGCMATVNVKF
jgi:hypothetical protein